MLLLYEFLRELSSYCYKLCYYLYFLKPYYPDNWYSMKGVSRESTSLVILHFLENNAILYKLLSLLKLLLFTYIHYTLDRS